MSVKLCILNIKILMWPT